MYQGGRSKEKHMDSRINVSGINTLDNVLFHVFYRIFWEVWEQKDKGCKFFMWWYDG